VTLVSSVKVVASWSGGKDSCLSCYKAICEGYEVSYLLNTISDEYRRVRFHGTEEKLIQTQARAIGMPLLQKATTADGYEEEFKDAIRDVIAEGIGGVVFGDIHLPNGRKWAEKICRDLGVQAIEPLWGCSPEEILSEFIESGFEATVVCTQGNLLGEEWVGRRVDEAFLKDILHRKDVDPCGENGEYHTLVTDGPLFKQRVGIVESEKVLKDGYWFLDVREYRLVRKSA
jgi:uncharacterized protein (TIGR00290 family)